jgi:adenylate cyclase
MQVPSSATSSLLHESVDTPPSDSSSIIEWLMTETRDQRFVDNIFVDMCGKLNQAGIPVSRGTLHFRILHPQWLGARILWQRGMTEADIQTFGFGIEDSDRYRNSPVNDIHSGAKVVRQRLEPEAAANAPPYPLYDELRAEGHTDYIAWPLEHTLGKHHIITFGSDRPGGFSDDDIAALADLLPAFALVSEIRLKNRLARTLLETYVGPHASEQILAGAIHG